LANIGSATLKSIKVTGTANSSFSDTSVVADVIGAFSTGPVDASNGAIAEGLAAKVIKSAKVNVDGGIVSLSGASLASDAAIASFLSAKGKTLGTFEIDIVTANPV
jgi:hypothetical protein